MFNGVALLTAVALAAGKVRTLFTRRGRSTEVDGSSGSLRGEHEHAEQASLAGSVSDGR
jgi:hypothetical protein